MNDRPRVTIGLPVYNGEDFIRKALDSILGQSFGDFELIITDNASSDCTPAICDEYSRRDARIRYVRNDRNLGAAPNFNLSVAMAKAPYFKWMAHDDLHAPDFLKRCVDVLDSKPDVVLCYSRAADIDEKGDVLGPIDLNVKIDSQTPHERFRECLFPFDSGIPVFGVVRTDVLRKTPLIGSYTSSDRVLVAELALHGSIYEIGDVLFYRRQHPGRSVRSTDGRRRLAWFDPNSKKGFRFPELRLGIEYLSAVLRAPLAISERMRCYLQVAGLLWNPKVRRRLAGDVMKILSR